MGGRPPKAPELSALQGDTRRTGRRKKKKTLAAAPVVEPVEPVEAEEFPPPSFLTARAKEIWRAEIAMVTQRTMLKATDHMMFGLYCNARARYERLEAAIERDGETYVSDGKHGKIIRANPAVALRDKTEATPIKLAIELNLTTKS